MKKRKKRFYINRKAVTALLLSLVLSFASVSSIQTQAEEAGIDVPPAAGEEPSADGDTSGGGEGTEGTEKEEEPVWIKTPEGAVVLTSFVPLSEAEAEITLEERETLAELTARMPKSLKAYAGVYETGTPDEEGKKPGEEDENPGEEDQKPGEEDENPGEEDQKPGEEDENPGEEDKKPGEEDENPGEEDKKPGEEDQNPGEEDKKPGEEDQNPGEEDKKPGEEDQNPGEEDKNPEGGEQNPGQGDQNSGEETNQGDNENPVDGEQPDGDRQSTEIENGAEDGEFGTNGAAVTESAGRKARWQLFVASGSEENAGSTGEGTDEERPGGEDAGKTPEESGQTPDNGSQNPEEGNKTPEDGNQNPEEGNKAPEDGEQNPEEGDKSPEDEEQTPGEGEGASEEDKEQPSGEPAIQSVEVEIPVTWECAEYEQEEQQEEQEEQREERYEYVFTPKWDSALWFYDMTAEGAALPTITVRYAKEEVKTEVSTQEELAAAFAAGAEKIVLKADIALTATLILPAAAKIKLDGEGHSLLRGLQEDGEVFPGTMIAMEGEDYTEETFGTLTLKSVTVDGRTEADCAAAPAILDRGELILEEDAVVQNNYNFGTYPEEGAEDEKEGENAETIPDYGGIQVYGRLTLTEKSLVAGNYADEFGGGVYLAGGSTLWLYADVIRGNKVPEDHGYGDDLYAASGSTIYYEPSIDMTRKGFYLCEGVTLIPMGEMALTANGARARGKEIFLHVSKDSGYTDEQVEEIKRALEEKGYTVLTDRRVDIDTTDLRDWYVYDHYEAELWGAVRPETVVKYPADQDPFTTMIDARGWEDQDGNIPPADWTKEYGTTDRRAWYPYAETNYNKRGSATTIKEWIENWSEYGNGKVLAGFKDHIWSRKEGGKAAMTFAGYGYPGYVDFLFYDPQSVGDKVVNFDVDSAMVETHTLAGNGFLLNTKVNEGALTGYVVYYAYAPGKGTTPVSLKVYYLENIPVDEIHNFIRTSAPSMAGNYFDYLERARGNKPIAEVPVTGWENQMCIQIKATPTNIEVRQTPKTEGVQDASQGQVVLSCDISDTGAGAFGPLVAYAAHDCNLASCFTYSNLSMYFTDAQEEQSDTMKPFERADFTQRDTQRYFINLLGKSEASYNDDVNFGQYREYLKLLQEEGVALVTDRDTPFDDYLGEANKPGSNLVEFSHDGGLLSVEELVEKIHEQLKDKTTTEIKDKVGKPAEQGGVKAPEVHHSAGNIWLKSVADGSQVRKLYGDAFGDGGYAVQIMDNITYYHGNKEEVSPVAYEVLKPGASGYVSLSAGASSEGDNVTPSSMGKTDDGMTITPLPFTVEKDKEKWPAGTYVVRQTVHNGSIRGYAFFDMVWGEQPPEPPIVPDTPIPDPPDPENPDPTPDPVPDPTPGPNPDPPGPAPDPEPAPKPQKPSGGSPQEPPAEYTEETVTIAAAEPMSPDAPEPVQEPEQERKPGEPKTGDLPIPALPVSVGACTAFVMKLRLWLYELEAGISEEKKNAIIRSIIAWAKNKSMVKVYLALAAAAVVVTGFHLLKTVCNGRRRVVALIDR